MSQLEEDLPVPDYVGATDPAVDPTLQMPIVFNFDDWLNNSISGKTAADVPDRSPKPFQPDTDDAFPEPPPDYDLQEDRVYEGLIPPHKLHNPVQASKDHKRLNREIKFISKRGASPLEQKPELQKELERRKLDKQKKGILDQQKKNRTSFEQKLDEQYVKVAAAASTEQVSSERERKKSELERIHNKILAKHSQATNSTEAAM